MFRTTTGSFVGEGPYLYSYSYAQLKNEPGEFGPAKGFFSAAATPTTLQFKNKVGANFVATLKVTRGVDRFGGVMRLLGSYSTKVCYFYNSACSIADRPWLYEYAGAAGFPR